MEPSKGLLIALMIVHIVRKEEFREMEACPFSKKKQTAEKK
jgi:hypothetical protein